MTEHNNLALLTSYWPPIDTTNAAFIAPNAVLVGMITLAEGSNIWYGSIIRGDVERIEIGAYTNIQDGVIIHGDPGLPTIVEDHVTVGHRAVIHGSHIESGSLIGIGAIIMDGVRIGKGSIIGAGSVVTKDIPPKSLVVGVPGKKVRDVTDEEAEDLIAHAKRYYKLALVHAGKGTETGF
ncbi:MAG TPA: gamma carbonic anhydrase family protein [Allocoleopsis sp.]